MASKRTTPIACRVPTAGKHLVEAAAAGRGVRKSDWLRDAIAAQLRKDLGAEVDLSGSAGSGESE